MIIRIKKNSDIPSSEITPESAYINRRKFLGASAGIGAATFLARGAAPRSPAPRPRLPPLRPQDEEPNTFEEITSYNNFYEFGLDKKDPSKNAHALVTEPWTVKVDGLCNNPADYHLEDFITPSTIEDRTYRLRCVEAWSMVVPWRGFPLADVIKRAEPTAAAKYVSFETLWDPEQMPERRWRPVIDWPYREGLRTGRGAPPAPAPRHGAVRQGPPQPERGAAAADRALEVRLQEHQVDRAHDLHRRGAAHDLGHPEPPRVRLLLERQP